MVTVKAQPRGLGKGLSALISEVNTVSLARREEPSATPAETQGSEISLNSIIPSPFQPRRRFTEAALAELADSIRAHGVMQPLIVRMASGGADAAFEIVAGERRWRAARMAGLETVPVLVRELTDQQTLELALIENIQRADLTPLEEGKGYQRLLDEFGYTQETLAGVVGKSRSHITNILRLLSLPEAVKTLLDEGRLSMGHARTLVGMEEERAIAAAEDIIARDLSVRQAEMLARDGAPPTPRKRAADSSRTHSTPTVNDPDIAALEETLSASLGMGVQIRAQSGNHGEIAIAYTSLAQLDELLRRLTGGA